MSLRSCSYITLMCTRETYRIRTTVQRFERQRRPPSSIQGSRPKKNPFSDFSAEDHKVKTRARSSRIHIGKSRDTLCGSNRLAGQRSSRGRRRPIRALRDSGLVRTNACHCSILSFVIGITLKTFFFFLGRGSTVERREMHFAHSFRTMRYKG